MKRILLGVLAFAMMGMSQAAITYVDADFTSNTLLAPTAGGGVAPTNTTDTADGIWRFRANFGLKPSDTVIPESPIVLAGGTVYESTGWSSSNLDDVPRVVTSVSGLALNIYNVYVYYWCDEPSNPWQIRAGLSDTVDPLPLFIRGDVNSTLVANDPSNNGGRKLWQALLGQVTGTSISVFVEDGPATNGNDRTWYDGIGYEAVPEPATLALLGLGGLLLRRRK